VVAFAKILQSLRHTGENFDGMVGDLMGKAANAFVQLGLTGSTESFSNVSTSECAKLCRP